MKTIIQISIALMLAVLVTTSALGESPATTTKINAVLSQEQKAMVLSHLRANPDPRSEATFNEFVVKQQSEKAPIAMLD